MCWLIRQLQQKVQYICFPFKGGFPQFLQPLYKCIGQIFSTIDAETFVKSIESLVDFKVVCSKIAVVSELFERTVAEFVQSRGLHLDIPSAAAQTLIYLAILYFSYTRNDFLHQVTGEGAQPRREGHNQPPPPCSVAGMLLAVNGSGSRLSRLGGRGGQARRMGLLSGSGPVQSQRSGDISEPDQTPLRIPRYKHPRIRGPVEIYS